MVRSLWLIHLKTAVNNHATDGDNPHAVSAAQAGALAIAENFADLNDATVCRANLGLGNVATRNIGQAANTVAAGAAGFLPGNWEQLTMLAGYGAGIEVASGAIIGDVWVLKVV